MISWFKKLFIQEKVDTDSFGLPTLDNLVSMPKVKPPKPEKDISEPVISFVECVKKNPKRFKATQDKTLHSWGTEIVYSILDKNLGVTYKVTQSIFIYSHGNSMFHKQSSTDFLTDDEIEFSIREVGKVYKELELRLKRAKHTRKRRELTKIYQEASK